MDNHQIKNRIWGLFWLMILVMAGGVTFIAYSERTEGQNKREYMQSVCETKASNYGIVLKRAESATRILTNNVMAELESPYTLGQEKDRKEYEDSVRTQIRSTASQIPGVVQVYLRFNVAYTDGKAGIFMGYDKKKRTFVDLEPTDLTLYDSGDVEHVGWYYVPMGVGEPTWMEPYLDLNTDVKVISFVIPVTKNDVLIGVLGMDISYDYLVDAVAEVDITNDEIVYLRDKSGNIIGDVDETILDQYEEFNSSLPNGMTFVLAVKKSALHQGVVAYRILFALYAVVFVIALFGFVRVSFSKEDKSEENLKYKRVKYVLVGLMASVIVAQVAYGVYFYGSLGKPAKVDVQAKNCYDKTLRIVGDEDFEPFSYYDEDGNITGHDIEFINELANRMEMNVEIELLPWAEARNRVKTRDADLIMGIETIGGNTNNMLFSSCIVDDSFVVYGKQAIKGTSDLYNKEVGTIKDCSAVDVYGILKDAKEYDTYDALIEALEKGEITYAVIRESVAQLTVRKLGYTDVFQVFNMIDSQLALGTNNNNSELMKQVDATIKEMHRDGTVERLQDKWITRPNANYTLRSFVMKHILFFGITFGIFAICIIALVIIQIKQRANQEQEEIQRQSELDHLTGIFNRGAGEKKIEEIIESKTPGMFCLMDADKFKGINDTYGHNVGDLVLIEIANCLKKAYRNNDVVMRLGGDEFAFFILFTYGKKAGKDRINRFFDLIDEIAIEEMESKKVEVSVGACFYDGVEELTFEQLYTEADACLYESKKQKGNYVTFSEKETSKQENNE